MKLCKRTGSGVNTSGGFWLYDYQGQTNYGNWLFTPTLGYFIDHKCLKWVF